MTWGTPAERERRLRIKVATAAYAYEIENNPLISDAEYDALAAEVDPQVMTGHPVYDEFFAVEYQLYTSAWVRKYPDQRGLKRLCDKARRART